MKTAVIIPDGHVDPNDPLMARFTWLGRLIAERQPDYVVELGDFSSVSALSHWDQDKRQLMEGRRYQLDMEYTRDAIRRMSVPVEEVQATQRRGKRRVYLPEYIKVEGNHELWVRKYIERRPELDGQLDFMQDSEYFEALFDCHKKTYIPFEEYAIREGVAFCHSPLAANGRPISGKYAVYRALELFDTSVIFGHLHRLESAALYQHGSQRRLRRSLSTGCFFSHEPPYALGAAHNHWRGVVVATLLGDGDFDFECVSLKSLEARYG